MGLVRGPHLRLPLSEQQLHSFFDELWTCDELKCHGSPVARTQDTLGMVHGNYANSLTYSLETN